MTSVSPSNRGNRVSVTGCCQPVMHRRANAAALHWRIAGPMMAGDQQHDAITPRNRSLETAVDRDPCAVEIHAVKVEDGVGLNGAAAHPLVPTSVERAVVDRGGC